MKTSRLIIASNRGPVEFYLDHDKRLKEHRSPGGLITVLRNAYKLNHMNVMWIALAMTEGDHIASKQMWEYNNRIVRSHFCNDNKMRIQYVAISKTAYHKHYHVISNQLLWFLQHYLYNFIPEDVFVTHHIQDAWTNGYCVANQAIANAVSQEIDGNSNSDISVVMLHDSHLYLAPQFIRKLQPLSIITQFIHIPWPDPRWWHFLPSNIEYDIYSSLVSGNDIIGFQTALDASNFIEGARSLLENAVINIEEGVISWQDHHTHIRVYPISISVVDERRVVQSAAGKRAAAKIVQFLGEKTIMRVDRIDPAKNILNGFHGYAEMLEKHPELLGKVVFLAFLLPTRRTIPVYERYRADVISTIDKINKKYGSAKWIPIRAFFDNDRTRTLSAMKYYDVLLVNPIVDGMNLIVKEGAVVNQRNGVCVLSRTAGAFQQLHEAVIPIPPIDVGETAKALYKALTLSYQERNTRWKLAQQLVERDDLNLWFKHQIDDINKLLDPYPRGSFQKQLLS